MKKLLLLAALAALSTKAFCNDVQMANDIQMAVELQMVQKLLKQNFYFIYYLSPAYIENNPTECDSRTQTVRGKNRFVNSKDFYLVDHATVYDDIQRCKRGEEPRLKGTLGSCGELALTLNDIKSDNPSHDEQKAATVGAIWKNALNKPL